MTHFGVICPTGSHLTAIFALGDELQQRGHRITKSAYWRRTLNLGELAYLNVQLAQMQKSWRIAVH
jgi:hypothetical protein